MGTKEEGAPSKKDPCSQAVRGCTHAAHAMRAIREAAETNNQAETAKRFCARGSSNGRSSCGNRRHHKCCFKQHSGRSKLRDHNGSQVENNV